jgi:hypothetical protein
LRPLVEEALRLLAQRLTEAGVPLDEELVGAYGDTERSSGDGWRITSEEHSGSWGNTHLEYLVLLPDGRVGRTTGEWGLGAFRSWDFGMAPAERGRWGRKLPSGFSWNRYSWQDMVELIQAFAIEHPEIE